MSTCTSSSTSTWCCWRWRCSPTTYLLERRGYSVSLRPRLSGRLGRRRARACTACTRWNGCRRRVRCWRVSDYEKRDKYLSFVCRHRAPCIAAHWAFLLRPLVLDHADERGVIRYRQIEYYRMPVMGYLAMDDPRSLSRSDFIRLGLVTARRRRRGAAVFRSPCGGLRGELLLRPLLERQGRRHAARAISAAVTRSSPWAMRTSRRVHGSGDRRLQPVPPPVLPACS